MPAYITDPVVSYDVLCCRVLIGKRVFVMSLVACRDDIGVVSVAMFPRGCSIDNSNGIYTR